MYFKESMTLNIYFTRRLNKFRQSTRNFIVVYRDLKSLASCVSIYSFLLWAPAMLVGLAALWMVGKLAVLRALPRILPEAVICVTYSAVGVLDTNTLFGVFPCVNEGAWVATERQQKECWIHAKEHFKPLGRFFFAADSAHSAWKRQRNRIL